MFEKIPFSAENREKNFEKIQRLLRDISEKYRNEGVPVDNDCRLRPPEERKSQDFEIVNRIKEKLNRKENINERRDGERLERMKTVILNKFLGENAIVVRSSEYDDIINGVDNVLVDREDGKVICAFDEVCDTNSEIFKVKKEKILKRNEEGGAKIKYCPKIKEGKVLIGSVENIPIFYLALNKKILEEIEKQIPPFLKQTSLYEEKLFKYFWNSLYNQAEFLYLDPKVSDEILNNLSFFKKVRAPK